MVSGGVPGLEWVPQGLCGEALQLGQDRTG